jgi:hypothetical protein
LKNYVVTGYSNGGTTGIQVGSDTTLVGSNAGGSTSQTADVAINAFVDFNIGDASTIVGDPTLAANINALPTVATLRVTLTSISAGTELMLVRTSNSQGLQDVGTVTILLVNDVAATPNSASFNFEWRNAANTAQLSGSEQMVFTSYDIDFTQRNSVAPTDYSQIGLATGSNLSNTSGGGFTRLTDPAPGTSSSFNNPLNAYAFVTVAGDFEQSISVDKVGGGVTADGYGTAGNQLYMFSFRSPSPLITTIPEPSSVILAGLGILALLRRRR